MGVGQAQAQHWQMSSIEFPLPENCIVQNYVARTLRKCQRMC